MKTWKGENNVHKWMLWTGFLPLQQHGELLDVVLRSTSLAFAITICCAIHKLSSWTTENGKARKEQNINFRCSKSSESSVEPFMDDFPSSSSFLVAVCSFASNFIITFCFWFYCDSRQKGNVTLNNTLEPDFSSCFHQWILMNFDDSDRQTFDY